MGKDCNCYTTASSTQSSVKSRELQLLAEADTLEERCKYSSDISDISGKKGNCLCLT